MRHVILLAILSFGCGEAGSDPAASSEVTHAPGTVVGTVAETMTSGGFTYVLVRAADGDQWAAIPETTIAVGDPVAVVPQMTMHDFESPTLGRTFDVILFGTLEADATPGMPSMPAAPAPAPSVGGSPHAGPATADGPIAVDKATGDHAYTIAEVHAAAASLKDQPVTIHAQVVKATNGVMGKNWLHVQDGSGSAAAGDHDLAVTTADSVAVGDVVLVEGVVRTDRDFGAGYTYGVIVEDATVTR